MMAKPKITVITPSYNQAEFLERTILSVINQNYENCEFLIYDGGSTDESVQIILKYEGHIAYWESEKDRGQSHAINKGLSRATGDLVGWLNSDDTLLSGSLESLAKEFVATGGKKVLYGDFIYIDEEDEFVRRRHVTRRVRREMLFFHDFLGQPAVYVPLSMIREVGGVDEQLWYGMDWDLFLRLSEKADFHHVGEVLATYRLHPAAKSSQEGKERYAADIQRIRAKNRIPGTSASLTSKTFHLLMRFLSYVDRLWCVIRDNPMDYLRMYNKMSARGFLRGLIWRIRN